VEKQALSPAAAQLQRFLRRPDVTKITGLSESSIYDLMAEGAFPKPIPLVGRCVAWLETEILEWQRQRIAAREHGVKAKRTGIALRHAEATEAVASKADTAA
jgi:prophage regulatory protein